MEFETRFRLFKAKRFIGKYLPIMAMCAMLVMGIGFGTWKSIEKQVKFHFITKVAYFDTYWGRDCKGWRARGNKFELRFNNHDRDWRPIIKNIGEINPVYYLE